MAEETLIDRIQARRQLVRDVANKIFEEDVHYGVIPGTKKMSLLKPGAEVLCDAFRLAPILSPAERIDLPGGHREWVSKCALRHIETGEVYAESSGSCSSMESKYRYRNADRTCPHCGKPAIIKGKAEYGGGHLCFRNKGGCGAKFADNDPQIVGQASGKIENPDVADQFNTVLKMAEKRSFVSATIFACKCSDMFTQDMESDERAEGHPAAHQERTASQPKAAETTEPPSEKFTRSGTLTSITLSGEYVRVGLKNNEGKEGFFFAKGIPPGLLSEQSTWKSLVGKHATINGEIIKKPDRIVYKINDMVIQIAGDPPSENKRSFEAMKAKYDKREQVLITPAQRAELLKETSESGLTNADLEAFLVACHEGASLTSLTQKVFTEVIEQLKSGFATQWCLDQTAGNFGSSQAA